MPCRHLCLILGDQLDPNGPIFQHYDPAQDILFMAEVDAESTHVPSHKARTALFLSAMRHFAAHLRQQRFPLDYRLLTDPANTHAVPTELAAAILRHQPQKVLVTEPGDHRVLTQLRAAAPNLQILPDTHFYCSLDDFRRYASNRRQLRLEFFYRDLRRRHNILMDGPQPTGNQWNFDASNRESFPKSGPPPIPPPASFPPDEITREVLQLVATRFPHNPGSLDHFDWPVTPAQAQSALDDFIRHRLPSFGLHQDAMWTHQPYLYHSRLSAALNLKLLNPRQAVNAAQAAYSAGLAPLPAVEGFIRQILGWREYVRGIYFTQMPAYAHSNALHATNPLPAFYWTGDTQMNCLHHAISQTLQYGYAHHIQRLMVTGLFALLYGVNPHEIHQWYLAVYTDAVEWVELPNTIGMSQFADAGYMASKPYAATGKYIQRMSNYCRSCPFDPALASGPTACPFTTLYWNFLHTHRDTLSRVPRMDLQLRNLDRLSPAQLAAIQSRAHHLIHIHLP